MPTNIVLMCERCPNVWKIKQRKLIKYYGIGEGLVFSCFPCPPLWQMYEWGGGGYPSVRELALYMLEAFFGGVFLMHGPPRVYHQRFSQCIFSTLV